MTSHSIEEESLWMPTGHLMIMGRTPVVARGQDVIGPLGFAQYMPSLIWYEGRRNGPNGEQYQRRTIFSRS
jgi:hypothetical protein